MSLQMETLAVWLELAKMRSSLTLHRLGEPTGLLSFEECPTSCSAAETRV